MYVGRMRRGHDAAVDEAGGDSEHPGRGVIKNVPVTDGDKGMVCRGAGV